MPITIASRKGISGVLQEVGKQRVVLTRHGRPVAVVDSAQRLDEDARLMREARLAVLDAAADLVSQRSEKFSLEQACARLGVDVDRVRTLARQRAETSQ